MSLWSSKLQISALHLHSFITKDKKSTSNSSTKSAHQYNKQHLKNLSTSQCQDTHQTKNDNPLIFITFYRGHYQKWPQNTYPYDFTHILGGKHQKKTQRPAWQPDVRGHKVILGGEIPPVSNSYHRGKLEWNVTRSRYAHSPPCDPSVLTTPEWAYHCKI